MLRTLSLTALVLTLTVGVLFGTRSVAADAEAGATAVVQQTMDQVIEILNNPEFDLDQKRTKIEELAYARFDFQRMSRLVLARNWKKLDETQRVEFQEEFKRHLSLSYGKRLGEYNGETISLDGARKEKNGDVTVMSTLQGGTNAGAAINYRMRNKDGEWLVLDVIIENISLIANFKSQIQEIVSSKGPDRLIQILREKNEKEAAKTPDTV